MTGRAVGEPMDARTAEGFELRWLAPVSLSTQALLRRYYRPQHLAPLCLQCENHGMNYACPPTGRDMAALLASYAQIRLYAARLPLPPALARADTGAYFAQGMVAFNRRLLAEEAASPGSLAIAPGQCVCCERCARGDHLPCRHPDSLRYSLDAFLLEIAQMSAELFDTEIRWYNDQPPEFLTMMGGLLLPVAAAQPHAQGENGTGTTHQRGLGALDTLRRFEIGREDR